LTLGSNPFRLHRQSSKHVIDMGFSTLADWDRGERLRDQVYGVDFAFSYEALQLISEVNWRNAYQRLDYFVTTNADSQTPAGNDMAWHVTLVLGMEKWLKQPFYTFARYGQWRPGYTTVSINCEYQTALCENTYGVNATNQLSLGFGYRFNDNLLFKFEYFNSLGTGTGEPYFERNRAQGQLVVAF
jgi:hypothetical protein